MRRFLVYGLCILSLFLGTIKPLAQTIRFENPDYAHAEIIFANHYGDGIYKLKNVTTDINGFTIIYNDSLNSGIYYLIFQDSTNFEILYDSDFPGKIGISKENNSVDFTVTGPEPTVLYNKYLLQLKALGNSPVNPESVMDEIISKGNSSFLTAYLVAQKNVKVPLYKPPADVVNKDSAIWKYRIDYYQKHYLDNLDLSDYRLINTPVYTDKINESLRLISKQEPKALKQAVDNIIERASSNSISQEYAVTYLLNNFAKKKGNAVAEYIYVSMIKDYILMSGYKWVSNKQASFFSDEYSRLLPASLFQTAPDFTGLTTKDKKLELSSLDSRYTILYFYDYDCSICERYIPKLKWINSVYNYLNISTFAVCMGKDTERWKKYLLKHDITNWKNISKLQNEMEVSALYNLKYTPTIFVLNEQKQIIAKNLNVVQLEDFFYKLAINRNKKP